MDTVTGPPMIVATTALATPKVRIGHLGGNITLPRTIPLTSLVASGVGGFVGIIAGLLLVGTLTGIMLLGVLGGAIAVASVTYSPLKGESLARYLGLTLRARRQRIALDGGVMMVAVGVAPLRSALLGSVQIVPGAVNVLPSQFDERGAPIDPDEVLRAALESTGSLMKAQTQMSGATYLDELEEHAHPRMPWRSRARPTKTRVPVVAPLGKPDLTDEYGDTVTTAPPYLSAYQQPVTKEALTEQPAEEELDPKDFAQWLPETTLPVPTPPKDVVTSGWKSAPVKEESTPPQDGWVRPSGPTLQ
jgi:hypothetical protein